MKITVIHHMEPSYLTGLVSGLSSDTSLEIDVIGADRSKNLEGKYSNVNFLNFRGNQDENAPGLQKIFRILHYYLKLVIYTLTSNTKIIHIQTINKFLFLDTTLINLLYKLCGKKIVFTAHNVDYAHRDNKDSFIKSLAMRSMYRLVDHVIVHNNHSKEMIISRYHISEKKISVIKIGINLQVTKNGLSRETSRELLSISKIKKVILFFGGFNPYKGIEFLIQAFKLLIDENRDYMLILAGPPRDKAYVDSLQNLIVQFDLKNYCLIHIEFIPDGEVEKYFMAADCAVLPYKNIFQSGVHVLSYAFGTPIIATNIGSFKEEIIDGKTGFVCEPGNPKELFEKIKLFFNSDLYFSLDSKRKEINEWAEETFSWKSIGIKTIKIYKELIS